MDVINIFAGPGSGKSTTAAGLFYFMKMKHKNVELVTEYAKDLVYSDQVEWLNNNQEKVFVEQARRQDILRDKVDYIITDGPLLLSHVYADIYKTQNIDSAFSNQVTDTYNSYNNINFFLRRPAPNTFSQIGRVQNYEDSMKIDTMILDTLNRLNVKYQLIPVDENTIHTVMGHLML